MVTILALLLLAYLIGSIPFAVLVSKAMGLADPRSFGSRNPGATNVLRTGNKLAALLTLLGDAAKGGLVVWATRSFAPELALDSVGIGLVALAVFLGHVFSCFLGFKGGKGVATAAGVLFGIQAVAGFGTLATWILIALISRYSSAAALSAAAAAPVIVYFATRDPILAATTVVMAAILIWRHKENIRRLIAGTETKLGKKKTL